MRLLLVNGRTHFAHLLTALLLGLAMLAPAQAVERVIHYHNDALGSPIAATDQEGRVVWRKSYAPYGQPIGPGASSEPGYTGKFEEPDLGIQNFGARWYDPRIGRFLAPDPAGFDAANAQSFNRYAYANNNPYKYVDPDGNSPLDAGFFIADSINFGLALASGNAGAIASAGADLAASAAGLVSPVPGTGLAIKAARAADKVGDVARVANGANNVAWPPNRGFDGDSAPASLIPGAKVDRYGSPNGTFVSPVGTPFPNRSLPASSASKALNTYEVAKP
ncbi:MAG: RHS repeat-associated core domain-containing protein, partial [Gammaproteobacteria bacterium]